MFSTFLTSSFFISSFFTVVFLTVFLQNLSLFLLITTAKQITNNTTNTTIEYVSALVAIDKIIKSIINTITKNL